MASRKEYELLFKLKASVGGSFNNTFKNAIQANKDLQNTMQKLNSVTSKMSGFKNTTDSVKKNKETLATLNEEYAQLEEEMYSTGVLTDKQAKKLEAKRKKIESLTNTIEGQENQLKTLREELKRAGVNTDNLEDSNKRLAESYGKLKKSQENLAEISRLQAENNARISKYKSSLLATTGVIAAVGTVIYKGPVEAAKAFESSMSDVIKVVDGLKDSTGAFTQEYYELRKDIINLSKVIPMSAEGLSQIAAAAGQAGIAREEIAQFAEDAAKMGVAFDTTAEAAGDSMAKWRTSFKLTQEEVVVLADKINYLSNNTASNATQISEIVTKIGPLGDVAGLASGEIAALGATLVGVGVQEDVAATGIKKLMTTMTAGTSATANQEAVLYKLGLSATDLAERMQVDAQGAILDFMDAVSKLPKAEQAAALKDYFGQESVAAIAPLLTSLEVLEENFYMVGDASQYAGSMEGEFAARSDTTANKIELMKNKAEAFSILIGETFLPMVGEGAETLGKLIDKVYDFTEANPELVTTLAKVAAGVATAKVGFDGIMLGAAEVSDTIYNAREAFELIRGSIIRTGVESELGEGRVRSVGEGIKKYFGDIKDSLGKLGESIGNVDFLKSLGEKIKNNKITSLLSGIPEKILTPFTSLRDKVGVILEPFKSGLLSKFSGITEKITNGPLGKIGDFISTAMQPLGSVFGSLGGVMQSVFQPLGSMFGGVFTKVAPIILIISALSALLIKLNGGDLSGFIEPIKQALIEAKPILESVGQQFMELGKKLLPLVMDAAEKLAPLFAQIITAVLPVLVQLLDQIAPILITVIEQILPVLITLITTLAPIFTDLIVAILPIIGQVFSALLEPLGQLIQVALPVLISLFNALMPVITVIATYMSSALQGAFAALSPIIEGLKTTLSGIITFITGVFTANWSMAWEGVKGIFGGIFESLVGLVKLPFNTIISGINGVFESIRGMEVPDWVPVIGGSKIDIPLIPQFAKGTNSTPDTFIAGEAGAELITNARNRKVFTAAETGNIFNNIGGLISSIGNIGMTNRPQLAYAGVDSGVNTAPTLRGETGGVSQVILHSNPVFHVNGGDVGEIDAKFKQYTSDLMNTFDEKLREKEDKERRERYD